MELFHGVRDPTCHATESRQSEFIAAKPQSPPDEQRGDDEICTLSGRLEYDVFRLSELTPFTVAVKDEIQRIRECYRTGIAIGGRRTIDESRQWLTAAQSSDRSSASIVLSEDFLEKAP